MLLDGGERGFDELRLVIGEGDPDVLRQQLLDLGHLGLDGLGHRHGGDAVQSRSGVRCGAPVDRVADIAQLDRVAAPGADDDLVEVLRAGDASGGADHDFALALIDLAAGQLQILGAERLGDLQNREVVGAQALGIELDANLAFPASVDGDLAHAVDRLKALFDLAVDQLGKFDHRAVGADGIEHDRQRLQIHLLHDGEVRRGRQIPEHEVHLLPHFLDGYVGVLFQVEDGDHRGEALHRDRAQLVKPGDGVHCALDDVGDLGLISCGEAPGLKVITVTTGMSTFGNRSTPREKKEKAPATTSDSTSMVANTGRWTQISASFCIGYAPGLARTGAPS